MRFRGQAELQFDGSARLCFASGLERAHTDVDARHPEAWAIDDRSIHLSLDVEVSQADAQAYRRLLEALLDEAAAGFAVLELGEERWERKLGARVSGTPGVEGSGAAPDLDDHPTMPAKAG